MDTGKSRDFDRCDWYYVMGFVHSTRISVTGYVVISTGTTAEISYNYSEKLVPFEKKKKKRDVSGRPIRPPCLEHEIW